MLAVFYLDNQEGAEPYFINNLNVIIMTTKEVINELLKSPNVTPVKGLIIKNVTVTPLQEYVRLAFTLDKPIKGYIQNDDDGTYVESETNIMFVSAFSIASILKENDEAAFAANHLLAHPEAMGLILSRATINILQEAVVAGEEYKNPFASSDNTTVFDHDVIINHVSSLTLSEFGLKKLDRLADIMLGA